MRLLPHWASNYTVRGSGVAEGISRGRGTRKTPQAPATHVKNAGKLIELFYFYQIKVFFFLRICAACKKESPFVLLPRRLPARFFTQHLLVVHNSSPLPKPTADTRRGPAQQKLRKVLFLLPTGNRLYYVLLLSL